MTDQDTLFPGQSLVNDWARGQHEGLAISPGAGLLYEAVFALELPAGPADILPGLHFCPVV